MRAGDGFVILAMKFHSAKNVVYKNVEPTSSTYSPEEPSYYLLEMALILPVAVKQRCCKRIYFLFLGG